MLKNKIIVKRIRNIIILLMAIIIMVGAYKNIDRSRAEEVIEIGVKALDNYAYLDDEEFILEARKMEDGTYEIELPESVNSKKINQISKITLEEKVVEEDTDDISMPEENENTTLDENTTHESGETTENPGIENPDIEIPEIEIPDIEIPDVDIPDTTIPEDEDIVEIIDNKIYLTQEQIDTKQIFMELTYDIAILQEKEEGGYDKTLLTEKTEEERKQLETDGVLETSKILYSTVLEYEEESGRKIQIRGYLPLGTELQIEEASIDDVYQRLGDIMVDLAYDINLMLPVVTYVPIDENDPESEIEEIIENVEVNVKDFEETYEVTVEDATVNESSKIFHLKDDNTYEGITVKEVIEGTVKFETSSFSIYVISKENPMIEIGPGEGFEGADDSMQATTYAMLRSTSSETAATSGFLGNTAIQRQNIQSVTFQNSLSGKNSTAWDASNAQDGSVYAWYTGSGPYNVFIGSTLTIQLRTDSTCLFSYIGYASTCTATSVINGLNLVYTANVTNMASMFNYCGYNAMTSLNLPSSFNTSNVTNMYRMFYNCGYKALTSLTLPNSFNTSKATNMQSMFANLGYDNMKTFNLGGNFNTSLVTDMRWMFSGTGRNNLTSLDLGDKFSVSSVTARNAINVQ